MKISINYFLIIILLGFISCNRIAHKTNNTVNRGGEVIGETATEFFEGVTEGVDKTLECDIILSSNLLKDGLKTGSYAIKNKSSGGENNLLTLYLIFNKDFDKIVYAKAFDKKGLEIGRSKLHISGINGEANYFDFEFDKRTYIGVRNKIVIE